MKRIFIIFIVCLFLILPSGVMAADIVTTGGDKIKTTGGDQITTTEGTSTISITTIRKIIFLLLLN